MSKDERSKFPRFRELLNEALLIKRTEQPSNLLTSVKAALAENLGYAIPTIERWRQGYLPGQEQAIEDLVRYFVPPMDRNWAEAILVQAQTKYPPDKARALIEELFPSVGSMHSSWRGEPAEDKTVLNRVITKIDYLRSNTDRPYTLLGSVYLDQIIISPISILELEKQEDQEITIYPFKYDLGGSTLWVGRILYLLSQRSSFLFSVQGRDEGDTFTREFKIRLSKETLLEGRTEQAKVENEPKSHRWLFDYVREIGRNDSRTAATLHLLTANHRFTTMLTHTGVLNDFDWGVVKDQLYRILKEGGTLYLAGYFKTNLSKELFEHLNQLAQLNTLVCLDHGRLVYGFINQGAVKDLLNAFASNAVDIYFCTLNELWRLYHFNFQEPVPEHSNNQQIMGSG